MATGRTFAVATALAAVIGLVVASGAEAAGPPSPSVGVQPAGAALTGSLTSPEVAGLLSGQTQVLEPVAGQLCEPVSPLGGLLRGGVLLGTAACVLGVQDFEIVSRLKTADGEIVRRRTALVNIPTLMDVDKDILPDLLVTVQAPGLNQFTLRVDRFLGEVSTLPVRVEAVLDLPPGLLPRDRVNLGYDARQSAAPSSWVATANLPDDGDTTLTTLNVTQDVTGAVPSLTTVGGLFDGDSLNRRDPMGGRLTYTPAPRRAAFGLTLGPYMEVRAGANAPVALDGSAEIVDGTREQRAQLGITGLPQQLSVRYEEPGTDQRTVTYASTADVPALDATFTDTTRGSLRSKALVRASAIPTGMVVKQTAARAGTFAATGGPLGRVEVGYANGEPRLLAVDHPYARVVEEGALRSYAGRVDQLLSASVDATDDVVAELRLGPDTRKEFRALVETPVARRIDGVVSDLPRHLKVLYSPTQGRIQYDAFGETVDDIILDAEQAAPFLGRVRRIHGRIEQLPPQAMVDIKPNNGGVRVETDHPIGKVEGLLTSGPDASLPAGELGAQVEDLTDRFTAFVRVQGLRLVDVSTGPGDAVTGRVKLASTPLRLRYLRGGQAIDARLSAIPDDVTLTFDPDAGKVDYAASAGIQSIDATVASDAALFGRVKRVVARVEALPATVSLGFKPASGSGATFSATPAVGLIEAALTDGRESHPTLPAGRSGVILRDIPDEFTLFGRLFNVRRASVTTSGADLDASLDTAPLVSGELQDLDLDVTFDTPGDAVAEPAHIVGFVQDLPATLALSQHGAQTTYSASSTVPRVTLDARNLPGGSSRDSLEGDLHNAVATLLGVPTSFRIVSTSPTTGVEANGPFDRVELEMWDRGPQSAAFAEDGRNKLTRNARDGRLHVQTRIFALSKILLTDQITAKVETEFGSAPAPLDVDLVGGTAAEPLDVDVVVDELPLASAFEFGTVGGMRIMHDAPTAGADVGLNVSSKDVGAVLSMPDLPSSVDVCIGGPTDCSPQSKQVVLVDPGIGSDSTHVVFDNDFTMATAANGTIRMDGRVCLPPSDDDDVDRVGDVYGACIANTAPNRIEIDDLRLKTARLELAAGDSDSADEDGDPIADGLLKLYLDSDNDGIRVGELKHRNDTADTTTVMKAGDPPLRNSGDFFFGLFDLSGVPSQEVEPRLNQLECGDLVVEVDLPLLGLTDVLPGLGEFFLGDICID